MNFKVGHLSDTHFIENEDLLADIVKCSGCVVETFKKESPDLITHTGDIFHERVSWDSDAAKAASNFIQQLGDIAPTIILKGTGTHDVGDCLTPFTKLKTIHQIYAADKLEQVWFDGKEFFPYDNKPSTPSALISCLPSPQKANLLSMTKEATTIQNGNMQVSDLVRDVLAGWGVSNDEARQHNIPSIIPGHCSILGAMTASGQQTGRDIELSLEAIKEARPTLGCFGHIHAMQLWKTPWGIICYSGGVTRRNFGEPEPKGVFIHKLDGAKYIDSQFINTPAREMFTIRGSKDIATSHEELLKLAMGSGVSGGNVKIPYTVTKTDMHTIDEKTIEEELKKKGVENVIFERSIKVVERSRCKEMATTQELTEKIKLWAKASDTELLPGVLEKATMIQTMKVEEVLNNYE